MRLVLAMSLLGLAAPAAAQEPKAPTAPTVKELEAGLEAAKASNALDEASRPLAIAAWEEALTLAREAETWLARGQELEASRAAAPVRLGELRAQLARPAGEPRLGVPAASALADLERELSAAQLQLAAAAKELADLDQEATMRGERRVLLPQLLSTARQRLEAAAQQAALPPDPSEPPPLAQARLARSQARRAAITHEVAALEQELATFEVRGELVTARRDLAARARTSAEQQVQMAQDAVAQRRKADAEQAARAAQRALEQADPQLSDAAQNRLAELAQRNAELAGLRSTVATAIEAVARDDARVRAELDQLATQQQALDKRLRAAGLTEALGLQLRGLRRTLPSPRALRARAHNLQSELARVQLQHLELEDQRLALAEPGRRAADEAARGSPLERAAYERRLRELLAAQRDNLDALVKTSSSHFDALVQLDTLERQLAAKAGELARFIDERVLWIRSDAPVWQLRPRETAAGLEWLGQLASLDAAWASCRSGQVLAGLLPLAAALAALLVLRRRLVRALAIAGGCAAPAQPPRFAPTAQAALHSVLLALPAPLALWLVGLALSAAPDEEGPARALSVALRGTALAFLALELLRQAARPCGLGEAHFGWRPERVALFRRLVPRFMLIALPAALLARTYQAQGIEAWKGAIGRPAFLVLMLALTLFLGRLLGPRRGVLAAAAVANPGGFFHRTRWPWLVLGVAAPSTLGVLASLGYYFSASQLLTRLELTLGLALGLLLLHDVLLRALQVARQPVAPAASARAGDPVAAAPPLDPGAVSASTRQLLRAAVTVTVLGGGFWIWVDVLPALGFLRQVELWSSMERATETILAPDGAERVQAIERLVPTTLADLLVACILVFLTVLAARGVPGFLALTLLRRLPIQEGERYAASTLLRYGIVGVGLGLALHAIGIGWAELQWLAAAVGIGLGFGLQEIFANFVSGLIILFERPVRVGDYVTVGEHEGQVQRIHIRATTVLDWDRREVIIPNKDFITARVVNWTLTDSISRVVVKVGVAYGSDTAKVKALLLRCAHENPYVLAEPAPSAIFRAFGASTLDFELRVFLASYDHWAQLVDSLHARIDDELRRAGIEIPFPTHDVRVRSAGTLG